MPTIIRETTRKKGLVYMLSIRKLLPAATIVTALALGACRGGDGSSGTGSDEEFVTGACNAAAKFQEDLDDVFADLANVDSEEEAVKLVVEPFENFTKAFKDLNPPADLKEWHSDAGKALDSTVAALKKGDTSAFEGDPFPEAPAEVQDRLNKVAAEVEACQETGLFE
ncbi:MAG: hypothetical protein KatS3mg082_3236 [Nitrospiraceae bacterium]|nr:MAG: hypothetical protein KatS3mg082_3236 [Nitrospiraceae bacterium]